MNSLLNIKKFMVVLKFFIFLVILNFVIVFVFVSLRYFHSFQSYVPQATYCKAKKVFIDKFIRICVCICASTSVNGENINANELKYARMKDRKKRTKNQIR